MNPLKPRFGARVASGLLVLAVLLTGCSSTGSTVDDEASNDEVAVGYGTLDRENLTSSVTRVKPENERRPIVRIEEMLERVPGVQLLPAPGGGIRVQIRGATSILAGTEPLYVVDGMPIQVEPGQGLNWLNPADVASIDVLKDASSTAIYGVRGANGVVIITTRRQ